MHAPLLCLTLSIAIALTAAVHAPASVLLASGSTYRLVADPEENNVISVVEYETPSIVFADEAGLTVGASASAISCTSWTATTVNCPVVGAIHAYGVRVNAGDSDDTITGYGNEDLIGRAVFDGGSGADTINSFGSYLGVGVSISALGGGGHDTLSPNGLNRVHLVTNDDDGTQDTVICRDAQSPPYRLSVDAVVDRSDILPDRAHCRTVTTR